LPAIFNGELGDVLSVVARRVVITIDFPAHVRPLSFVGREGTIRGQRAEFSLNQLYGGQEKFALVEAEVDSARAGDEREIASASVVFEDALTQREAKVSARSAARFSGVAKEVVAAVNQAVQVDYAKNSLAVAKDEAVALVDSGRQEEAAKRIRSWEQKMAAAPAAKANLELQSVIGQNASEADRLQREGLSNEQRKLYRADSAQTASQQASGYSRP
jgi:Ca-activated chloride channel family protein